jgi:hypothetical protein
MLLHNISVIASQVQRARSTRSARTMRGYALPIPAEMNRLRRNGPRICRRRRGHVYCRMRIARQ